MANISKVQLPNGAQHTIIDKNLNVRFPSSLGSDLNVPLSYNPTIVSYGSTTSNSPYTEGLTDSQEGFVISQISAGRYGAQLSMGLGSKSIFVRSISPTYKSPWEEMKSYPLVMLWENESPSSSMASQTISIEAISDYDVFFFVCDYSTDDFDQTGVVGYFPPDVTTKTIWLYHTYQTNSSTWKSAYRCVTINKNAGTIKFNQAKYNGAANDSYCIPFCIMATKLK